MFNVHQKYFASASYLEIKVQDQIAVLSYHSGYCAQRRTAFSLLPYTLTACEVEGMVLAMIKSPWLPEIIQGCPLLTWINFDTIME